MKTFIEIGSCDFDTNLELIRTGNWSGILVEPADRFFKNLQEEAMGMPHSQNVILENVVISDYNGEIDFACVKPRSDWARGISSVVDTNHQGERMFDIADGINKQHIESIVKKPCITLDTLIDKHNITSIDYLKIDTEGHELNIIKSYSWKIKPTLIKIEHSHIDNLYCEALLKDLGYLVYREATDIYGII